MKRETVDTGTVWEGLAGYSRAVRIGDRILVSGLHPRMRMVMWSVMSQPRRPIISLTKLRLLLNSWAATSKMSSVPRIYLRYAADWEAVSRVHGKRFGQIRPANTLVEAKLIGDEYLVEIEAEAVVGAGNAL